MLSRRTVFATLALVAAYSLPAYAFSGAMKYTPDALMAAQKSGKPVLVDVSAPWCPTCKAQKAVMAELEMSGKYKAYTTIEVDFDSQKDALKRLNATMQSTLIVFKGDKEIGRLVGDAKKASIEALLAKAL